MAESRRRINSIIQAQLWGWGDWVKLAVHGVLSYPPVSVEGRLIQNGGFVPSNPSSKIPNYYRNHQILELNNKINTLPEKDQELIAYRYACNYSHDEIAKSWNQTARYIGDNLSRIETLLTQRT